MVKRLIICQDGTWNHRRGPYETNVSKIRDFLENDNDQLVEYGIGIGAKKGIWGKDKFNLVDKFLGGITGWGISQDIIGWYKLISEHYVKGAKIFLLGFSRGAYTVRSLSGFLHLVGILKSDAISDYQNKYGRSLIEDAYNYYRLPEKESPYWYEQQVHRYVFGATSRSEFLDGAFKGLLERAKDNDWSSISVELLGVWDTVGSIGAPFARRITHPWVNFHDTALSPNVVQAYQAMALHELRKNFPLDIWTSKPRDDQIVEQAWFAGAHSNIGGGYPNTELSTISLQWMIDKCIHAGLTFKSHDHEYKEVLTPITNHFSQVVLSSEEGLWKYMGKVMRPIPTPSNTKDNIREWIYADDSVKTRLLQNPSSFHNRYHEVGLLQTIDATAKRLPTRSDVFKQMKQNEELKKHQNFRIYVRKMKARSRNTTDITSTEEGTWYGNHFVPDDD